MTDSSEQSSREMTGALAKLKAARDSRSDDDDTTWQDQLPDLPQLPEGERKVAVHIPERKAPSDDES